jgi:hypothetical protein
MKQLIRHILKETAMSNLIDSMFPHLNKLKTKSNISATIYGRNTIYYNSEDKEYYFRVSEPRKTYVWLINAVEEKFSDKTLFIDGKTYDEISNYVPDENMIINWFNQKYNQDVKVLRRRSPLKGR